MMDAMTRADLYWKESAKYSDLAKDASTPFLCAYYRRIAKRYLTSEGELRLPERQSSLVLDGLSPAGSRRSITLGVLPDVPTVD
jgi:hypothetical protein